MSTIVLLILLPLCLAFFVFCIYAFLKFDAAIGQIYDTERERWRSLGGPMGFFWRPSEKTGFLKSTMSRNELFSGFLWAGLKWPNPESCDHAKP